MRSIFCRRAWAPCATTAVGLLLMTSSASADLFHQYGDWYRNVTQPTIAPGSFGVAVAVLPDGRLITATGLEVLLESEVGSNIHNVAATIDASILSAPVDPGFLVVSPGGTRIALGAGFNKPVIVFDAALLNARTPATLTSTNAAAFAVNHFAAAWIDEQSLAITGGDFGQPAFVTVLDTTSNPAAPENPIVIDNIDGASGGIAIDDEGAIYTSNGFDNSPNTPGTSETGWIKRFTLAEWSSGVDFENDGLFLADLLSASTLVFDRNGALIVGGGDFDAGDFGNVAVINASALNTIIESGVAIDTKSPAQVKRLDPLGNGSGFFGAAFNPGTDELLLTDFAGWFATSGRITGDLNGDDEVAGDDLASLLAIFASDNFFADLNHDGVVNGADLAMLLANWGRESK